jgi:hypothetical protein
MLLGVTPRPGSPSPSEDPAAAIMVNSAEEKIIFIFNMVSSLV